MQNPFRGLPHIHASDMALLIQVVKRLFQQELLPSLHTSGSDGSTTATRRVVFRHDNMHEPGNLLRPQTQLPTCSRTTIIDTAHKGPALLRRQKAYRPHDAKSAALSQSSTLRTAFRSLENSYLVRPHTKLSGDCIDATHYDYMLL